MKRKIISAILAVILLLSLEVSAAADWKSAYNAADSSSDNSGENYLDSIDADIEYPKSSDYLKKALTRYVKPSGNNTTVYALHGLNDGGNWKKLAKEVDEGTEVEVIAEHSYKSDGVKYTYSCCIYEKDGYTYAGWISNSFLATKKSTSSGKSTSKSGFAKDLDDIDADIEYPSSNDYLKDYAIRYVKPSGYNTTVYALHGLNDGGNWKKLAKVVDEGTKVVVLAQHSYKSDGLKYTYSCCIYEDDGVPCAGWINNSFLAVKK